MGSRRFVKIYRRVVEHALALAGFQRKGSDFWRIRDHVLHFVVLHRSSSWNFTGEFAIQPLVFRDDSFTLNLGGRVDEMEPGRSSWWDLPEDEDVEGIERVVKNYAGTVVRYVVPWLDRFQTCRDVIETDLKKRWGIWLLDTPTKSKEGIMLGLCALAGDMPKAGRDYLELAQKGYRQILRPDASEWVREDLRLVEEYLAMLDRGDREGIKKKLAEGEEYTRKSIGLPPAEDMG